MIESKQIWQANLKQTMKDCQRTWGMGFPVISRALLNGYLDEMWETIEALRAVARASQQLERYGFGFPEVPEPECDGLSDALAALPSWLLEDSND